MLEKLQYVDHSKQRTFSRKLPLEHNFGLTAADIDPTMQVCPCYLVSHIVFRSCSPPFQILFAVIFCLRIAGFSVETASQ